MDKHKEIRYDGTSTKYVVARMGRISNILELWENNVRSNSQVSWSQNTF